MILPMALVLLLIITVLVGAATLTATNSNSSAGRDSRVKQALQAADAGLRAATYRLSTLGTQGAYCPVPEPQGVNPPSPDSTTNLCPKDGPETIGPGIQFSYWVSGALQSAHKCAGNWITSNTGQLTQRCITSVGTINGQVLARTQSRVVSYSAVIPFASAGLVGESLLSIKPGQGHSGQINSTTGSYSNITLGNNVTLTGYSGAAAVLGNGTLTTGNGDVVTGTTVTGLPSTTFNIPAADPANAKLGPPGTCTDATGATIQCNSDYRVASCVADASQIQTVDQCSPTGIWTNTASQPRWVSVPNNGVITLGGGVYDFCSFTTGNNAQINIAAGVHVTIYIDSYYDQGSGCPQNTSGTGQFVLGNGTVINNPNVYTDTSGQQHPDPTAFQIYIFGDPQNPTNPAYTDTLNNNNSGTTPLTVYAPNSIVNLQNNGTLDGGVYASQLFVTNNFTFNFDGIESAIQLAPQGAYYRAFWQQCPAIGFNSSSPASGC